MPVNSNVGLISTATTKPTFRFSVRTAAIGICFNSQNGFTGAQFGASTDVIVPADYDGDGKTDLAVYRAGTWYLQRSTAGFTGVAFGASDDIPQPADFDGDGKAELAVWRPSNGIWYVYNLTNNQFTCRAIRRKRR